jgi:hypothetical protein
MRNDPDGLIMPEARDATAIDDLEDASFGFYGGVRSWLRSPNALQFGGDPFVN